MRRLIERISTCGLVLAALACQQRDLAPVRLEPMATIGDTTGPGAIATWPRVSARHPLGYRVVVPQPGSVAAVPLVYDDDGAFLGPLVARDSVLGGFVEPLFARIGPGDSVWVFDGAQRALVFSPTREHVRTVQLPLAPWDAVVLADGRLAVTPATFGEPLPWLLLDGEGGVVRSIGEADSLVPSPRRIVPGTDNTVWTIAMTHRWQLEHWGLDGTLLDRFDAAPPWFAPYDALLAPAPDRAPQSAVQDAWVDTAGRLWIVGKVAGADWREGIGPAEAGGSSITDADRAYDTIVEAHDPATGAVITEARFDPAYPFMAEPGVLMRVVRGGGGWQRAELARVLIDESRLGPRRD